MSEVKVINQAANVLQTRGWRIARRAGETTGRITRGNEQGQIIIQAREVRGNVKLMFTCSTSTIDFNIAVTTISDASDVAQEPIQQCRIVRSLPGFDDTDFIEMETEFFAWWEQCNLDDAIKALVHNYSSFGSGPLYHLVALVLTQQIGTLKEIKEKFEHGENTGFPHYITQDYINRALKLSQESGLTVIPPKFSGVQK